MKSLQTGTKSSVLGLLPTITRGPDFFLQTLKTGFLFASTVGCSPTGNACACLYVTEQNKACVHLHPFQSFGSELRESSCSRQDEVHQKVPLSQHE